MSMSLMFFLLACGLIAIFLLVRVILSLLKKERVRKQQIQEVLQQKSEARKKIIDSIHILLRVVGSEELNWIEASIRIKTLLDQLSVDLSDHDSIKVFYAIYAETEHIPTHDGWSVLPKSAKQAYRKTFAECEEKYAADLEQAKQDLLTYPLV